MSNRPGGIKGVLGVNDLRVNSDRKNLGQCSQQISTGEVFTGDDQNRIVTGDGSQNVG